MIFASSGLWNATTSLSRSLSNPEAGAWTLAKTSSVLSKAALAFNIQPGKTWKKADRRDLWSSMDTVHTFLQFTFISVICFCHRKHWGHLRPWRCLLPYLALLQSAPWCNTDLCTPARSSVFVSVNALLCGSMSPYLCCVCLCVLFWVFFCADEQVDFPHYSCTIGSHGPPLHQNILKNPPF